MRRMIGACGGTHASAATRTGGVPSRSLPPLATEFELRARQLHLTPDMYAASHGLRLWWCERNRNRVYVPEWLLEEWGIAVDGIFDRTA